MKKERRKKEVKLRKNFFLTLLVTILLWLLLASLIYFTEPTSSGILILFFLLVFLSLTFTSSIIFVNTRRGLTLSLIITFYLFLRYLGVGNIINFLLLLGVAVAIEIYSARK